MSHTLKVTSLLAHGNPPLDPPWRYTRYMDLLGLHLVRPGTTDGASDNTSMVVGRKVKKHSASDIQ